MNFRAFRCILHPRNVSFKKESLSKNFSGLVSTHSSSPNKFNRRLICTVSQHRQMQINVQPKQINRSDIVSINESNDCIEVKFDQGKSAYPFLWLRDNCQCDKCFCQSSLGRKLLMSDLNIDLRPQEIEVSNSGLKVLWNDGHQSVYDSQWLLQRSFDEETQNSYERFYRQRRKPWSSDIKIQEFDYNDLKTQDNVLMKWLLQMETDGVALIKNAPNDPDAGAQMIDHVAFVKQSHYGRRSPVIVRENSNNLAFSNVKLGLHNDLAQYFHQAGIIFIQAVLQDKGEGGKSTISDGLNAVQILKERNPEAYKILSEKEIYFWDKGIANIEMENDSFHKITKQPVIRLGANGELESLRVNNQVRDSHMNMAPSEVTKFYEAAKELDDILYENTYALKMENGDILTLDNVRCLHGRDAFSATSGRHIESSYLDWDEALCKRRRIQETLGVL